jgi:anthranilate synthase component 1
VARESIARVPGLPRFLGGAVGYLGYETARHFERLPASNGPPPPLPESAFLLAENLAVFDHVRQRLQLLTMHRPGQESYDAALTRLDEMEQRLSIPPAPPPPRPEANGSGWRSNVTRGQYESMVDAAREHILAGDAFQVVLSQRFSKPLGARPFDVYRQLRGINPSPYMYYLSLGGGRHIVGTSPELLVRVEGDRLETRPLAGTRRRGRDGVQDAALESELRADEKERAEHVMLVDLGRNDVGRVAAPGSVRVERLMEVERYSHVMHLSSLVSGDLAPGRTSLEALRAAFPAGTVSGAPKIRAMEIIAALEPEQRGCYAGALGYVGFGGNLDLAITLRTIVIAGGTAYVQAGAGVVADSDPRREFEETLEKAGAMFAAIERAEAMP